MRKDFNNSLPLYLTHTAGEWAKRMSTGMYCVLEVQIDRFNCKKNICSRFFSWLSRSQLIGSRLYIVELLSIEKTILSFHVFLLMHWNVSSQPNSEDLEKKVEELRKEYQEARLKARGVLSGNNTPNSGASPVNNVSPK